jgi:hypothetical protein
MSQPLDINLPDIPVSRVRAVVMELLGHELKDVVEVQIGLAVIRAVVYARDEHGNRFHDRDGNGAAKHVLTRRVVR